MLEVQARVADEETRKAYLSFWDGVGTNIPTRKGAPSTDYYYDCERRLFEDHFPDLRDRSILKTDLWDEAKNSEILRWAVEQGARPFGVDVAYEVIADALKVLGVFGLGFLGGDVCALPFQDNSFDLIYSMGTIEHFPEYAVAVREMFRVLKPGGTAIVGVPNKLDPILRPLMVDL